MHITAADKIMNEVTLYGGFAMRRCDVYKDALERTESKRAADTFAFTKDAIDAEPVTLEEMRAIIASTEVA